MQRLTLIYLATYLLIGGCSFLAAPAFALRLLLSNGAYADVMPRLFGLFMFVLGGVIFQFVRARDYRYYLYTIVARGGDDHSLFQRATLCSRYSMPSS